MQRADTATRMRGAPPVALTDTTSLDDDQVDVGPRIGWLLRTSRLTAGDAGAISQAAMRRSLGEIGIGVSAGMLSDLEQGRRRNGAVTSGYERVLALEPGRLTSAVDILCRTFPSSPSAMPESASPAKSRTVAELSDLSAAVARPGCTGGTWLTWSKALESPCARGLPSWVAAPWVDRLVSELGRSVGAGYVLRYEALTRLRCGQYGALVLDAARRALADQDVQVLFDLMSAVSERAENEVLQWAVELLQDARPQVVRGAMLALHNMVTVGDVDDEQWRQHEEAILAAYASSADRPEVHGTLSDLLVALPGSVRRRLSSRLAVPPRRPGRLERFGPVGDTNPRWVHARRISSAIAARHGLHDEPVLTRLVFDLIYQYRDTHAVTTSFLMLASPVVGTLARALAQTAVDLPPAERLFLLERLAATQAGAPLFDAIDWDVLSLEESRLLATLEAQCGHEVPEGVLNRLLEAGGAHGRRALYVAGMNGQPWLAERAADGLLPPPTRAAAAWWLRHGSVVIDAPPDPEARPLIPETDPTPPRGPCR